MLGQLQGQGKKPETLEIMYVQYYCNRLSSFRDLLRKQSVLVQQICDKKAQLVIKAPKFAY